FGVGPALGVLHRDGNGHRAWGGGSEAQVPGRIDRRSRRTSDQPCVWRRAAGCVNGRVVRRTGGSRGQRSGGNRRWGSAWRDIQSQTFAGGATVIIKHRHTDLPGRYGSGGAGDGRGSV